MHDAPGVTLGSHFSFVPADFVLTPAEAVGYEPFS
jgi:hypothetical protein